MAEVPGTGVTLKVYEGRRLVATLDVPQAAEIGRREPGEPPPYARVSRPGGDRLIIADLQENSISRKSLRVEPGPDGTVALTNESSKNGVALGAGERLRPGERRVVPLPVVCELGNKVIRFEEPPSQDLQLQSLREPTMMPGQGAANNMAMLRGFAEASPEAAAGGIRNVDLLAWLQASMEVFQSASSSAEFLPKAAQAAAQMVEMDTAAVLLLHEKNWSVAAVGDRSGNASAGTWQASQSMLGRVVTERRTFYHVPPDHGAAQSLIGVQSIVAAPILDRRGEVVGVLYGERRGSGQHAAAAPIREVEAKLFELLAYGVASGLARMDQERQLIAERVRFEQFFTPELTRMLESHGDAMLAARDAEITVLFCDIKGFSRISNNAGAALAIEWVRDVLSALSDCVADCHGVLIDYTGDALEAIWGAPLAAADHAAQACRAALQMRSKLPELNRQWESRLGERTDICIGINSGRAHVGNIGSRRKFKYGAFGTTVNLASRVETATRHVGVPLLITRSTVAGLNSSFYTRRLCTVRTVNIGQPVDLFELTATPEPAWLKLRGKYEQSLDLFEQGRFADAKELLDTLLAEFPGDEPAQKLQARSTASMGQAGGLFDSVWNLGSK